MQTKDFLRIAVITGIVATLFLPLLGGANSVSGNFFFPFITPKNFAFRIIVELLLASWVLWALLDRTVRPRRLSILYAMGLFVLSLGISAAFAENPIKAVWSNFERMEGWVGLLHLGAYFLVLTSVLRSEKIWKMVINVSIGVSFAVGLYGVGQLLDLFVINQGGVRVDGTLGNATYFAVYMLFHVFLTMLAWYKWGGGSQGLAVFYGIAGALQTLMIFAAATRGAIIGLIAGVFITGAAFLIFGKGNLRLRQIGVGVVVGILVLAAAFSLIKDSSLIQKSHALSRLATISFSELETRFTIWQMAFQGFTERPMLGWGQEGFNYVFNKYYEPSLYAQEQWFDRAHNAFIDWLIAGGILGFLLYLSLFGIALWYLVFPRTPIPLPEQAILVGLLGAYSINNSFVFDNLTSYMFFLLFLAYVAHRSHEAPLAPPLPQKKGLAAEVPSTQFMFSASVVFVATIAVVYVVNVPGISANTSLLHALRQHPEGLVGNFEMFKNLAKYQYLGRQEIYEQLIQQFGIHVVTTDDASPQLKNDVVNYILQTAKKEFEQNHNDARSHVFLGSFLRVAGASEEARAELLQALTLSPKKQVIMLEIGISYYNENKMKEAMEWFKKAYDLDPRFEQAVVFYAVTAIESGDKELVASILTKRFGTATPDNDNILRAYFNIKDFRSVIGVLNEKVLASTTDPEPHLQLHTAYLELGDRTTAILELRKAIELRPSLKDEVEAYIRQIETGQI